MPSLGQDTKERLVTIGGVTGSIFATSAGITAIPAIGAALPLAATLAQVGIAISGLALLLIGYFAPEKQYVWLDYRCRSLEPSELDGIHNMVARYAGGTVVSIDKKLAIYNVNPQCFSAVEEVSKNGLDRRIVGYIMIYYLNKAVTKRILAGEMHGAHVTAEDIVTPRSYASSAYVGFVWARGRKSRAATLKHADALLKKARRHRGFLIFTRPTTVEALRAVNRRSFKTVLTGMEPTLGSVCQSALT